MGLDVEDDVASQEQHDQHDNLEITPILAREDFARRRGRDQHKKARIDQKCCQPADVGGKRNRDAAGDPD